jgi:cobalt-zinc-cadmium efflux system outer membrane protein
VLPVAEKVATSPDEPQGALSLREALALALLRSPELATFSYDTRAAEARTLQAGFRPNPEVSLLSEDFGGNRQWGGFQQAQTTLALSQTIELGAKRAHRLRLSRLDESLAAWDFETKRLDVFVEVTKAFVGTLVAQRKVDIAADTLRIEQQFFGAVADRVRAGKVSPIEQQRADVSLANGRIILEKAKRELSIARDKLASFWGSREARFAKVEGDLNNIVPPPPLERLTALAAQNPDLARWETEIQQREARLAVERSKEIPDLTIQGGVRKYGVGGTAFVAGIGMPLPVFGTNRGNIGDAQAQLSKGLAQQRATEVRITTAIRESYTQLAAAYEEATTLRRDVLPAADAAFNGTSVGYRNGKFGLLEVLDARRSQTEAQNRLLDALSAYQAASAVTERLTGQSLREPLASTKGDRQ